MGQLALSCPVGHAEKRCEEKLQAEYLPTVEESSRTTCAPGKNMKSWPFLLLRHAPSCPVGHVEKLHAEYPSAEYLPTVEEPSGTIHGLDVQLKEE